MNAVKFAREVRQEMNKVVWPTYKETMTSTVIVLFLVVLAAFFFWFFDSIISWAVYTKILGLGGV